MQIHYDRKGGCWPPSRLQQLASRAPGTCCLTDKRSKYSKKSTANPVSTAPYGGAWLEKSFSSRLLSCPTPPFPRNEIPDFQPWRYSIMSETTTNFRVWSLRACFGSMGVRLLSSAIRRGRAKPIPFDKIEAVRLVQFLFLLRLPGLPD